MIISRANLLNWNTESDLEIDDTLELVSDLEIDGETTIIQYQISIV